MARSAVAVVVGFSRRAGLLQKSFAPLRKLKQAGVLDRVLYVTWDRPDLDSCVSEIADMPEVEMVRIPEPAVSGLPYQKKHFYQTHNLAAALDLVPDDDTLVLKMRPDQVIDANFLAGKILSFDYCCAPSRLRKDFSLAMPSSPFAMKIWTPWADSNQPFFMEDGLFAALRGDAVKLVTQAGDDIVRNYGDENSLWITNAARFIEPFRKDYPIFDRYLQEFHLYAQNDQCRYEQLGATLFDPFFLHLVLANAWILADSFHIDCGHHGQVMFYPPEGMAPGEDKFSGKTIAEIESRPPFNKVDTWRSGQKPGSVIDSVRRLYGRLMDDNWQRTIFAQRLTDLTEKTLRASLQAIRDYPCGALAKQEAHYYATIAKAHGRHVPARPEKSAA